MARRRRSSGGSGVKGIFSSIFSVKGLIAMAIGAFMVYFFPSLGTMVQGVVNKVNPPKA